MTVDSMRHISCSEQVSSTARHEHRLQRDEAGVTRAGAYRADMAAAVAAAAAATAAEANWMRADADGVRPVGDRSYLPARIDVIGVEHTARQ